MEEVKTVDTNDKRKEKCIDSNLIPLKALYFMYYSGLCSFIPYKSIFQKQLGMSAAQNGVIQATMQLVSIVSPPVCGILTDKTKRYKLILSVCLLCSIVFTTLFYFVPAVQYENVLVSCCHNSTSSYLCSPIDMEIAQKNESFGDCKFDKKSEVNVENMTFKVVSSIECSNQTYQAKCENKSTPVYSSTFVLLVILTMVMSFFLAPVTPLVDACAMEILERDKIGQYGAQRLWGAVGFGLTGLCVSFIIDYVSPKDIYGPEQKNYIPAFVSAALFWTITTIVLAKIKGTFSQTKPVLKDVGKLLIKPQILSFLFVVFASGYSTGIQYSYLFWYLQNLNGFTQLILGLSVLVTCISEIPMFYISGWICEKLGYVSVLSLGLIAVAIRFLTYTFITDAWTVLLVEWLHGISFALPMAAMCTYATLIAPHDSIATLMSLSQTVYWGLGNMAGALIGGVLYQTLGGKTMFHISGAFCALVAILYWLLLGPLNLISLCCKPKSSQDKMKAQPVEELPLNAQNTAEA